MAAARRAAEEAAVVDIGDGMAYVTRHAECRQLLRDTDGFSSAQGFKAPGRRRAARGPHAGRARPATHTLVRRVMVTALTPKAVKAASRTSRRRRRRLLDALPATGEADLVPIHGAAAQRVHSAPARLPRGRRAAAHGVGQGPHRERVPRTTPQPRGRRGLRRRVPRVRGLHRRPHRRAEAQPDRDDVTTKLLELEVDGERLTPRQLRATGAQPHHRRAHDHEPLVGNLLVELFTVPGLEARLRTDADALPRAIEESLRLAPPVMFVAARGRRDTDVVGDAVCTGASVS